MSRVNLLNRSNIRHDETNTHKEVHSGDDNGYPQTFMGTVYPKDTNNQNSESKNQNLTQPLTHSKDNSSTDTPQNSSVENVSKDGEPDSIPYSIGQIATAATGVLGGGTLILDGAKRFYFKATGNKEAETIMQKGVKAAREKLGTAAESIKDSFFKTSKPEESGEKSNNSNNNSKDGTSDNSGNKQYNDINHKSPLVSDDLRSSLNEKNQEILEKKGKIQ